MGYSLIYKGLESENCLSKIEQLAIQEFGDKITQASRFNDTGFIEIDDMSSQEFFEMIRIGAIDSLTHGKYKLVSIFENDKPIYQYLPKPDSILNKCEDVNDKVLRNVISKVDILLVTITESEKNALLPLLEPINGYKNLIRGSVGNLTYLIAKFGRYNAAHIQSNMGSLQPNSSIQSLLEAVNTVNPKAILMIGIAFGIDKDWQNIGDVLIAESVQNYEFGKIDNGNKLYKPNPISASNLLMQRFKNLSADWRFQRGADFVKVHFGNILSGEKVINDLEFRNSLLAEFPNAIGGEMEGIGFYSVCSTLNCEYILVKGICDWADGEKDKNSQEYSAFAAASLALHVCSKPDSLSALNAKDQTLTQSKKSPNQDRSFNLSDLNPFKYILHYKSIVCYKGYIEHFENEGNKAIEVLGSNTTSELNNCKIYITKRLGYLYCHSNYIKQNKNYPTKICTKETKNIFEIFINLVCNTWPTSEFENRLLNIFQNKIDIYIDIKLDQNIDIELGAVKNVFYV